MTKHYDKSGNCSCCGIVIESPKSTDNCPNCKIAFKEFEHNICGSLTYEDGMSQPYSFWFIKKTNITYSD